MRTHDPPRLLSVPMHPVTFRDLTRWLSEGKRIVDAIPHDTPLTKDQRMFLAAANEWEQEVVKGRAWAQAIDKKAA